MMALVAIGNAIAAAVMAAYNAIKAAIEAIWNAILAILKAILDAILAFLKWCEPSCAASCVIMPRLHVRSSIHHDWPLCVGCGICS